MSIVDSLFSSPFSAIAYMNDKFELIRVNEEYANLLNESPKNLVGQSHFNFFPEEKETLYRQILDSGQAYLEYKKPISLSSRLSARLFFDFFLHPISNTDSRQGLILSLREVTDWVLLYEEKERADRHVEYLKKLQAFDDFAGGIAHYLNNLLTVIHGNIDLIQNEAPPRIRKHLASAGDAANRASVLIKQLLSYSQKSPCVIHVLDINRMIDDAVRLAKETIDPKIEIRLKKHQVLTKLSCDGIQISSVLLSLICNARDAIHEILHGFTLPERKNDSFYIAVETKIVEIESHEEFQENAIPGKYALISITDNGIGIDNSIQHRIFDPFFTTKPPEKGKGLSLSSAYGIIRQHDGWISVASCPGQGTTVRVFLPLGPEE